MLVPKMVTKTLLSIQVSVVIPLVVIILAGLLSRVALLLEIFLTVESDMLISVMVLSGYFKVR